MGFVRASNTGQELFAFKAQGMIGSAAFSAHSMEVISTGLMGSGVTTWNPDTGTIIRSVQARAQGGSDWFYILAVSQDGDRFLVRSISNPASPLKVCDASTGKELLTLHGHKDYAYCAAFSPDGKRIISGGRDQALKVWDADSGHETLTLARHTKAIRDVAFSPDGRQVVSGGGDGVVIVWSATDN